MDSEGKALLIDAEGCIALQKDRRRKGITIQIHINNTSLAFCRKMREIFCCGAVYMTDKSKYNYKWNTLYNFRVYKQREVLAILSEIYPYLVIKKDLCKKALDILKEKSTQKSKYYS